MPRVLVDFHHSSLLRSLVMLFEDRLGMEVYRPIGMEWFEQGFWAINDLKATAYQFLAINGELPIDGTPPLNKTDNIKWNTYSVEDPGGDSDHMACTLDYFKDNKFDYVIASIPAHVPIFKKLIELYQPDAKLIIQQGNNWVEDYAGENILASRAPQITDGGNHIVYYHQEFDLELFKPQPLGFEGNIFSFVNVIQNTGIGWEDYQELKEITKSPDYNFHFKAFGGQCPDGNMTGPREVADAMAHADFIFHVKPGGDGFGHIIHSAYAAGRPIITRSSHYANQLAAELLQQGTFLDIDVLGRKGVAQEMMRLAANKSELEAMGRMAAARFKEVVNYEKEAEEIRTWLDSLN